MEFKYSKNSSTLDALRDEIKAKEQQERELAKQNEIARKKKEGYFCKGGEMIDWVLAGNRIIDDNDIDEWMQLIDGKVVHQYLVYNDIDMPIGYTRKAMSIDDFKKWVADCEEIQIKEHRVFVNDYFHKD